MKIQNSLIALVSMFAATSFGAEPRTDWQFDFRPGSVSPGAVHVSDAVYSKQAGYGFLGTPNPESAKGAVGNSSSHKPFIFAVDLPEGNYNVTVTLGDRTEASETTVKAQSRELMLENVKTAPGKFESRTFTVNIRTPKLPGGGAVSIDRRESGPPIAAHWDDRLALEFDGNRPSVSTLEISKARDATTVFLAGDSTVTQQPAEPWAGWGQMLPRFLKPGVAVANHAESGLALYSFKSQKRLEKVLSVMKPGDYLFIQFGHNDQKDKTPGAGPFTSYKANLKFFIREARKKGGIPVLVTPMERRRWTEDGKPQATLADYAEAVRQTATEDRVPVIDLNAMSLKLYEALGPEGSKKAFVHYPAGTFPQQTKPLKDDTHHNVYGGYELAKCMVEGIKANIPALAKFLTDDVPAFDPSHPDPVESVRIPPSPVASREKPAGS